MNKIAKTHSSYNFMVRMKENGEDLLMPSGRPPESQIVSLQENIFNEEKKLIINFSNDEDMELYKYLFGKYLANDKFEIELYINNKGNLTSAMTLIMNGEISSINIVDLDYTKRQFSQTRCCFDISNPRMK